MLGRQEIMKVGSGHLCDVALGHINRHQIRLTDHRVKNNALALSLYTPLTHKVKKTAVIRCAIISTRKRYSLNFSVLWHWEYLNCSAMLHFVLTCTLLLIEWNLN